MNFFREIDITRYTPEGKNSLKDVVVNEYSISIYINGKKMSVLLCSPVDLDYLTVGFLASEGFIKSVKDIKRISIKDKEGIAELEVNRKIDLEQKNYGSRTITTSSSRGSDFYNLRDIMDVPAIKNDEPKIDCDTIFKLVQEFDNRCMVFKQTGGVHACALGLNGNIEIFHEDIGRHNAMDKVIGHGIKREVHFENSVVITSGRIASEMIMKAAKRRIPIYISRSAPTTLSVKIAKELNITLIGFARGKRFNVYNGIERIL